MMITYFEFEEKPLKKGLWSSEEDEKLIAYINRFGIWNWNHMPKPAGLERTGKSCRLRWLNYLRPDIKHGKFSKQEDQIIINLHQKLGNRWSAIAGNLSGRTYNEIKNHWNSHLKKLAIKETKIHTSDDDDADQVESKDEIILNSQNSEKSESGLFMADNSSSSSSSTTSDDLFDENMFPADDGQSMEMEDNNNNNNVKLQLEKLYDPNIESFNYNIWEPINHPLQEEITFSPYNYYYYL